MSGRRGHGEGSIYYRQDRECWCAMVDLGYQDGKRKRKSIFGKTRKEVAEKLKVVLRDQQQGLLVAAERQTVEQFLTRWLAEVVEGKTRPRTHQSYKDIARLHIIPTLGKLQLSKVTPEDVQRLMNRKLAAGLSPRSVQYIRAVLRMALAQALKWGSVARNVATLVDPPKAESAPVTVLSPDQARTFLNAARGDRYEALYRVAVSLGLRRGEVLGLRWQHVDLERGVLRVAASLQKLPGKAPTLVAPKTKNSRRALPLPAALISALQAHRARQVEEQRCAGTRWQEYGLVFPTSIGTPINPPNLVRAFHALLERAELPHMRFHDLRHSCATLLAEQHVPERIAMEILGHSDIRVTQNIYTHVFDHAKRQASDAMDRLFGDGPVVENPDV